MTKPSHLRHAWLLLFAVGSLHVFTSSGFAEDVAPPFPVDAREQSVPQDEESAVWNTVTTVTKEAEADPRAKAQTIETTGNSRYVLPPIPKQIPSGVENAIFAESDSPFDSVIQIGDETTDLETRPLFNEPFDFTLPKSIPSDNESIEEPVQLAPPSLPRISLFDDKTVETPGDKSEPFEFDLSPDTPIPPLDANPLGMDVEARPEILNRPIDLFSQPAEDLEAIEPDLFGDSLLTLPMEAPTGFAGPSSILPRDSQTSSHFVPVDDRWRIGFPEWDRYDQDFPFGIDYPYKTGRWYDPYNQNVIKGDYPIRGEHLFLKVEGIVESLHEFRQLPANTTAFESTVDPFSEGLFGDPNQYFTNNVFFLNFDLFHGNAAFKPIDWQVRVSAAFNLNYLDTNELGQVNPNVLLGTTRQDEYVALEEYFFEYKLSDTSPHYDFLSMRVGSQPFLSDFRGFIFNDINRGIRFFGTRLANRDQYNIVYFDMLEKDTNSVLNTFDDRHQNVLIMNYYRQDFIFPGYVAQASFHWNHDQPSTRFDRNDFLARPDPTGIFQEHRVNAYYLGVTGQGHIGKINISNAFYWVLGRDSNNPIAGQPIDINAQMAAVELSYDRDWIRFRGSFFFASGDDNPNDNRGNGFDTILDSANFAGGEFSFFQRQQIQLFGVGLTTRESLVPNLRSSKPQGQANFVNPGLLLFNYGMDFEVTPKFRIITNANYLMFDDTEVLETFTFQDDISRAIGTDISVGFEWRPFLNDNVVIEAGFATLIPDEGFRDLYGSYNQFTLANANEPNIDPLYSVFVNGEFVY